MALRVPAPLVLIFSTRRAPVSAEQSERAYATAPYRHGRHGSQAPRAGLLILAISLLLFGAALASVPEYPEAGFGRHRAGLDPARHRRPLRGRYMEVLSRYRGVEEGLRIAGGAHLGRSGARGCITGSAFFHKMD